MAEDRLELLLEAERRGLGIDAEDRALLAEARRRNLIGGETPALAPPGNRLTDLLRVAGGTPAMETGGRHGRSLLSTPESAAGELAASRNVSAAALRVAPALAVANPLAAGALSAGGEAAAQMVEGGEVSSPLQIGVAGALPPLVSGVVRGARALGRTAVRLSPGLFQRAQGAAQEGAEDVAAALTPETSAKQLFEAARGRAAVTTPVASRQPIAALPAQAGPASYGPTGRYVASELTEREGVGRTLDAAAAAARGEAYREGAGMTVARAPAGPPFTGSRMKLGRASTEAAAPLTPGVEAVPAGRILSIIDDLDTSIPKEPTNAALQQVRAFMDKIRGVVNGGAVGLDDLMRQRLDLGREIARPGSAPELRALYGHGGAGAKGIIGALEEAASQGGAGASAAKEALTVFKRDLGIMKWRDLVEQATKRTSISGVDTPALNVARLGNLVEKNAEELTAQLGPEGMALVRGFLAKSRSLPPTHAANFATRALAVMTGGLAGIGTGSIPIGLGAALIPEIATNVFQVGKNPVWVNQLMAGLAQASRAAVVPAVQPFNGPRVVVSPEARDLARGRR